MKSVTSLSGYPEWLPEDQLVVETFTRLIRGKFEQYGFIPLETRAVEPLSVLLTKGETDKEIYLLRRLQAGEDETDKSLGLHFDLTYPFARYASENKDRLVFPFRRYQIQKSWRGERPSLGRFREFLQADFDIIDNQDLTVELDLEVILTANEIMTSLPIPEVRLLIGHRKLLEGAYRAMGIQDIAPVLRIVDKLEKIGDKTAFQILTQDLGIDENTAAKCIRLGRIKGQSENQVYQELKELEINHPLIDEGWSELTTIMATCNRQAKSAVFIDLSIARGLDYYTGMVLEGKFIQFPAYPSIIGGGRYDNLASGGSQKLPGVGMTIGISRILGLVLHEGLLKASRKTPTCVLVALISDAMRDQSAEIARNLRRRGIPCEVYPRPDKYGKQIAYAEKKGIPFVWFPAEDGKGDGEVRDIRVRDQKPADINSWNPDVDDLNVKILYDAEAYEKLLSNRQYTGKK